MISGASLEFLFGRKRRDKVTRLKDLSSLWVDSTDEVAGLINQLHKIRS